MAIVGNCRVDKNQRLWRDQVQPSSEVQIQIRAHVFQLQGQVLALMRALSKFSFTRCSVNKKNSQTKNSGAAVLHTHPSLGVTFQTSDKPKSWDNCDFNLMSANGSHLRFLLSKKKKKLWAGPGLLQNTLRRILWPTDWGAGAPSSGQSQTTCKRRHSEDAFPAVQKPDAPGSGGSLQSYRGSAVPLPGTTRDKKTGPCVRSQHRVPPRLCSSVPHFRFGHRTCSDQWNVSRRGCHLQVEMSPFPSCQDNWSWSRVKLSRHRAPESRQHVAKPQQTLQEYTEAMRNKPLLFFFMPLRSVAHLLPQHNLIYLDGHRPFSYFTWRQKKPKRWKDKIISKGPPWSWAMWPYSGTSGGREFLVYSPPLKSHTSSTKSHKKMKRGHRLEEAYGTHDHV